MKDNIVYIFIEYIQPIVGWAGSARPGRAAPIIVPVKDFYNTTIAKTYIEHLGECIYSNIYRRNRFRGFGEL